MKKLNFTEEDKLEIYNLYKTTRMTNEELGKKYNVCPKTIYNIRKEIEKKFIMNGGNIEHGKKITISQLNGIESKRNESRKNRVIGQVECYQTETSTSRTKIKDNHNWLSENKKQYKYVDDPTIQDYVPKYKKGKSSRRDDIISIDTSEFNSDEEVIDIIPISTTIKSNNRIKQKQKKTITNTNSNKRAHRNELKKSTMDFLNNQKTIMENRNV